LIDRVRLIKLLGPLGFAQNGEIASTGRMADALIKDAGVTWADVIAPDAVRPQQVDAPRAENEELREKVRQLLLENDELQVRRRASRAMFYRRRNRAKRFARRLWNRPARPCTTRSSTSHCQTGTAVITSSDRVLQTRPDCGERLFEMEHIGLRHTARLRFTRIYLVRNDRV
jgi:hypothetical protein